MFEQTLQTLDDKLTNALNNGDAAAAELVTLEQLKVAVDLKDLSLLKNIRTMRLELFQLTNQKMKARTEYNKLANFCSEIEMKALEALTSFQDEVADKADKPLLDQIDTYFIVDNLHQHNNGILNSVLRKMTLFEEEWGYRTTLVVCEYNQDLKKVAAHHQFFNASRINVDMKIVNVYEYFQKTNAPDLPTVARPIFDEVKPNTQKFYDQRGYLSMVRIVDERSPAQFVSESYYTTDGKLCIKSDYTFKGDKNEVIHIEIYDENGTVIHEGTKEADLVGLYLDKIAADSDKPCLFVSETGLHNKAMSNIKQKNVIRTAMVHAGFLENSYDLKSKPQYFFKDLVYYQGYFDGIVFLTKYEGDDFARIYGKPQRIFTVPHFYPKEIEKVDFDTRDRRKAVIVARFDPIKRLPMAVDIFKLVVEKLPDVTLELYGFGSPAEQERIQNHIKKTGMQNNVFIKGSTERPEEVFSSAALFMMTSDTEGFGITLIESISNGCPAFSFNIKYGPSDVIRNGKTGCLVPRNNIKAFAKQIISYFEDQELQRQMSENCYQDAKRFQKEVFLENWYSFMASVSKPMNLGD